MNSTDPNQPQPDNDDALIDPDEPVYAERPNKAEGKRETDALRALSLQIAALPPERLSELGLSEKTLDAIEVFNRIKDRARSGRKRQVQLLVKLMRNEDTDSIQATLDGEKHEQRAQSIHLQQVADLRDQLLADDALLENFLKERNLGNEFRTLVRQARREQSKNAKPHAQRALYRQLQSLLDKEQHNDSE